MKVPHLVQYQGSKRIMAPEIIKYFPITFDRLIEPFLLIIRILVCELFFEWGTIMDFTKNNFSKMSFSKTQS